MKTLITLTGGLLLAAGSAYADTLIHSGRLIDGESGRAVTEVTVRVSGDTIVGIERGYTSPASDDTVIDLRDQTVLPGLMDMHVHLTLSLIHISEPTRPY